MSSGWTVAGNNMRHEQQQRKCRWLSISDIDEVKCPEDSKRQRHISHCGDSAAKDTEAYPAVPPDYSAAIFLKLRPLNSSYTPKSFLSLDYFFISLYNFSLRLSKNELNQRNVKK